RRAELLWSVHELVAEALLHRLDEAVSRVARDSPTFIQDHPRLSGQRSRRCGTSTPTSTGLSTTESSGAPCPSLCRRTSKPFSAWRPTATEAGAHGRRQLIGSR